MFELIALGHDGSEVSELYGIPIDTIRNTVLAWIERGAPASLVLPTPFDLPDYHPEKPPTPTATHMRALPDTASNSGVFRPRQLSAQQQGHPESAAHPLSPSPRPRLFPLILSLIVLGMIGCALYYALILKG